MYANRTRSNQPSRLTEKELLKLAREVKRPPSWSFPANQGIWGLLAITALLILANVVF